MSARRPDVAICGGGLGGLSAAWRLSDPGNREAVGRITVYQRGWRLGGKAASSRGPNGRIEEHGLHVWLGYYDNAFRMIRECYDVLDRADRRPECPIITWRDAFFPSPWIGVEDRHRDGWQSWVAEFSDNELLPGEPIEQTRSMTVAELARRSLLLIRDFARSLDHRGPEHRLNALMRAVGLQLAGLVAEFTAVVAPNSEGLGAIESLRAELAGKVLADSTDRRLWHLIDVVLAHLRGIAVDRLASRGLRSIDHLEYRQWLSRHGASEETLDSALVRAMYGLVFAHLGGDPRRQSFPAGLGLFLASKMYFDYKGSLFWKMRAGMGDVVIAPLYEALRERGVDFEFFCRIDDVVPSADGDAVDSIVMTRQATLARGRDRYEPLIEVAGLSGFPDQPLVEQLDGDTADPDLLETIWDPTSEPTQVLSRGIDFDEVIWAIPPAMSRHTCRRLAAADPRWQEMIDGLGAVATKSVQLWLRPGESELGWGHTGATVTGYVDGYDTWASMSHLVQAEDWPAAGEPGTIAYFCSTMTTGPIDPNDREAQQRALAAVRESMVHHLEVDITHHWPEAVDAGTGTFCWDLLVAPDGVHGEGRLDHQYLRANVDPSDQYVQALPGTDRLRLRPDRSGFAHLHLAGDWTDSGLNAGCVEAAVLSGLQAANSVLGRDRRHEVTGAYLFG